MEHDNLRDNIGQAIHDAIMEGAPEPDWHDSREVDRLADAVMKVLESSAEAQPVGDIDVENGVVVKESFYASSLNDGFYKLYTAPQSSQPSEKDAEGWRCADCGSYVLERIPEAEQNSDEKEKK